MSIYQQLLMYYVTSDLYFLSVLQTLAWDELQVGGCGPEEFTFETEFYRSCRERFQRECGFQLDLPDETIKEYFENYNIGLYLLPAILVAHWFNLSKKQINDIRHSRPDGYSPWHKVFKYILPEKDNYIIYTASGEVKAVRDGAYLVAEDGRRFEIDF